VVKKQKLGSSDDVSYRNHAHLREETDENGAVGRNGYAERQGEANEFRAERETTLKQCHLNAREQSMRVVQERGDRRKWDRKARRTSTERGPKDKPPSRLGAVKVGESAVRSSI